MRNYLVLGDYNACCDRCGFKFKASMLRLEWTGLRVCQQCFEVRHPQTMLRVPEDNPSVPWSRPEATDVFVDVAYPLSTEDDVWIYLESGVVLNTN
jgi:hypothetical protein